MKRLFLIRHGETEANAEGRMVSSSDPPLNASGAAQVDALGRAMASASLSRIVSSPMLRCRQTAEAICHHHPHALQVEVDERLRELGFGEIEGLSQDEIVERGMQGVFASWRQGCPPRYPVGAETFGEAAERMRGVFEDVTVGTSATVLVGHSHALRILLAVSVLGATPEAHRRMRLDHGEVTEVRWEGAAPRLVALNSMSMLQGAAQVPSRRVPRTR